MDRLNNRLKTAGQWISEPEDRSEKTTQNAVQGVKKYDWEVKRREDGMRRSK